MTTKILLFAEPQGGNESLPLVIFNSELQKLLCEYSDFY